MTPMKRSLCFVAFLFAQLIGLQHLAQAASSPCNSPNGNLFNLEPRPDAVVQVARSRSCPTPREITTSYSGEVLTAAEESWGELRINSLSLPGALSFAVSKGMPECRPSNGGLCRSRSLSG
jgi:hypothetical protein